MASADHVFAAREEAGEAIRATPLFHFINGEFVPPVDGGKLAVIDPATRLPLTTQAPAGGTKDVDAAVAAAAAALPAWRSRSGRQRAVVLKAVARVVREHKRLLALTEAINAGKPLPEAEWDMDDVADAFEYNAGLAVALDGRQGTAVDVGDGDYTCELRYQPVGVVAAIVPFNYPLLMATWKVAAALGAGCAVVLKPSELTPLTALQLANLLTTLDGHEALPAGVLNVVVGTGAAVGSPLSRHPLVNRVSFTGSLATGRRIMATCARDVRSVGLELGGKSAAIVFDDMDDAALRRAAEWVCFGVFWTNGQICSATSRLLVQRTVYPRLLGMVVRVARSIVVGHPLHPATKLGPLVSDVQQRKVLDFIAGARAAGATVVTGGGVPKGLEAGNYVEATVITDIPTDSTLWQEEVFGPVLAVRPFDTEADAIREANASKFGLAAAVFTACQRRADRVTNALDVGIVWQGCSQPCFVALPWGGTKLSGAGSRDNGQEGFDAYLETKQVVRYDSSAALDWYPIESKL